MPTTPDTFTPDACPQPALAEPWATLARMAQSPRPSLEQLFSTMPERSQQYCAKAGSLLLDYSRQAVDEAILEALAQLADNAQLSQQLHALRDGAAINNTEQRSATHMQLRAASNPAAERRWAWADAIHEGRYLTARGEAITDVVNIGIGGSYLGPALVTDALGKPEGPRCHFLSNVDPQGLQALLPRLNPRTTLWLVSSKSFGTPETMLNANAACEWMDLKAGPGWRDDRLAAMTANANAARALGIADEHIFSIADSVGGRYSIWSAVDLPVAIACGSDTLRQLHRGAQAIDQNALQAPLRENIPMLMALIGIWNRNFLQRHSLAVVPYDNRLEQLPDYLQQLVMESNGKQVNRDGQPVSCHTSPVIWGGIGSNGQHSFHQCLHQGTDTVPVDFLIPAQGASDEQHDCLVANALAQAHTLAFGSASTLASAGDRTGTCRATALPACCFTRSSQPKCWVP